MADFSEDRLVNIVTGGSTAMGTGATTDEFTVSTVLSHLKESGRLIYEINHSRNSLRNPLKIC